MSVCCEFYVLLGRRLFIGLINFPEDCVLSECNREASIMRRPKGLLCCEMKNSRRFRLQVVKYNLSFWNPFHFESLSVIVTNTN